MWRLRTPQAPRVSLWRRFMLLAAPLVVAVFANILLSLPAMAADAIWDGNTLTYEGKTMTPTTAPPPMTGSPHVFEHIDTTVTPNRATVIYFAGEPQSASTSTATVASYDVASGIYSNPSPPQAINVSRNLTGEQGDNQDSLGTTCSSQATQGVGWVICPLSNWLADGVDAVYGLVEDFLTVTPVSDDNTGIYQLWDVVRTIANVCFVLAFIVIIYSQLTSIGYSNYNLKDMIPRLIIAAILVNVSFWIAALAVDISNLLGHSIQAILVNIRENYATGAGDVSWVEATAYVLSGGGIAAASLAAATMGSGVSLVFLIVAALISVAFAVLVAFIILAARQAIITMLIIIAPLAFVAYILPNTRSLFSKWGKAFTTMLVFFPLFALVFGGAQLAGAAIMGNAGGRMHIILIGMATQVAPLIITPLLIRFSTGILGQIANMANSKTRGPLDRLRNWAHDNADMYAAEKGARWAQHADAGNKRRYLNPIAMLGSGMDRRKRRREKRKALADEYRSNRADHQWNEHLNKGTGLSARNRRQLYEDSHAFHGAADIQKKELDGRVNRHFNRAVDRGRGIDPHTGIDYAQLRASRELGAVAQGQADLYEKKMAAADDLALKQSIINSPKLERVARKAGVDAKEAGLLQESVDAKVDESWAKRQDGNKVLRQLRTDTHHTKGRAQAIEDSMTAADKDAFETLVNTASATNDNGYLQIRQKKIATAIDTAHAELQSNQVAAEAKRAFRAKFEYGVEGSGDLRRQYEKIDRLNKETAAVEAVLQHRADTAWQDASLNNPDVQKLRMQESVSAAQLKEAETKWNELTENARTQGSAAEGLHTDSRGLATTLRDSAENTRGIESAIESAKNEQNIAYVKRLKNDESFRKVAAGIGGKEAQTRILAQAKAQVVKTATEAVQTNRTLASEMTRGQLHKVMQRGVMPDGTKASVEMQQAAMYVLLQDKGNNEDAQEIRDVIARQGMMLDEETGEYYEALRDDNGRLILDKYQRAQIDRDQKITDENVIGRRRDWQQFFADAMNGSSHSMVTLSGTNKSEAKAGTMVDDMRHAFVRDAIGGKLGPGAMKKADIDELKFLLEDMHDPQGIFATFSDKEQATAKQAIKQAILGLQGNEEQNAQIDPRNRGAMNDILNLIDPDEFAYTKDSNGKRLYDVDRTNAIVPKSKADEAVGTFAAPLNVPGVHYPTTKSGDPARYYKEWDLDLQLDDDES